MTRECKIGLFLALLVGAGAAGYSLLPHQPSYAGRTLSAWLADLDLERPGPQEQAAAAVRVIGTNGLPWLRRMLRSEGPLWERLIVAFNASQSLVQFPITPDNLSRNRAVRAYHILANDAAGDVPRLVQLLKTERSPRVRSYVALALGNIGPAARAALPALRQATTDPNADVRRNAFWALANLQMWAPDELPAQPFR